MILYGLALTPLATQLREAEPSLIQPWYADDAAMSGPADAIARAMRLLEVRGPARGYYPEPSKSIFIPDNAADADRCREILVELPFKHQTGARYLGSFLGSDEERQEWLRPQIQTWVEGIQKLATVAHRYPQTAYAGLVRSLQSEWMYLQRVVPDCGMALAPIEEAITTTFLPALFGSDPGELTALR